MEVWSSLKKKNARKSKQKKNQGLFIIREGKKTKASEKKDFEYAQKQNKPKKRL